MHSFLVSGRNTGIPKAANTCPTITHSRGHSAASASFQCPSGSKCSGQNNFCPATIAICSISTSDDSRAESPGESLHWWPWQSVSSGTAAVADQLSEYPTAKTCKFCPPASHTDKFHTEFPYTDTPSDTPKSVPAKCSESTPPVSTI